jgi:cytochrome c oxidase subunit II
MKWVLPLVAGVAVAAAVLVVLPAGDESEPAARPAATADPGRAVFAEMGCGSCHRLAAAGSRGEMAPDLDARLPGHTRESLRAVIVKPPRYSMMPDNFGERMTPRELDALVEFLLASARR